MTSHSTVTRQHPISWIFSAIVLFCIFAQTVVAKPNSNSINVTLVVNNQSGHSLTFTPQLTVLPPAATSTATLTNGGPIRVAGGTSNNQAVVSLSSQAGAVTLQLDGSFSSKKTAFSFIQAFGRQGPAPTLFTYNANASWPFNSSSVTAKTSRGNYTLTLTIPPNPIQLPRTKWTTSGTKVLKDGVNFFAKGVDYCPTPIGGATFEPGVGDWFSTPWCSTNSATSLIARDIPNLQGMGVNAMRTYYCWYWMPRNSLTYLGGITQSTPMTVNTQTQYPYTVFYDHGPFLDACYQAGVYVVLGIAINGGNCFDFSSSNVSKPYQNFYLQTAEKIATLYGQHPAVMGFCMGNEQNQYARNIDSRTWMFYQSMYQKIKKAAPDKLVTIAFQDEAGLYNGTRTVKDKAGQSPATPFNNIPVEKAISMVVDVWGLNTYSGISSDFPTFQQNVIQAANGAYARPLWLTEWGTPAGRNSPRGVSGPTSGNAKAQELSQQGLLQGATTITNNAIQYIQPHLSFIAGGFYFAYSDEWWKNTHFIPVSAAGTTNVNTTVSPYNPATGLYQTNPAGQVTMTDTSLQYPAYPYTQDAGSTPSWPSEMWGLFSISSTGGRSPINPDPNNPDAVTARPLYTNALCIAYTTLSEAYTSQSYRQPAKGWVQPKGNWIPAGGNSWFTAGENE